MKTDNQLFKPIAALALATAFLLLIPLTAMQYTNEVNWTLSDFIFAGVLLFGTGLVYILVTRVLAPARGSSLVYRIAVGFALFTGLFLIWANGAVGIIGSEDNAINLLYYGVIAVGIIGAFLAQFQSEGLMRTMFAMAFVQALIAVTALMGGWHHVPHSSVGEVLAVNGFFIMLYSVAALLFRHDAQVERPAHAESQAHSTE